MHIVDQIVEQNLGVYRASPTRLREDVQQEAQVASDYRGRLAYELLQNADDAMAGEATQRDYVKFLLTDDALWMANNGRPLSDDDVQGLCGLGASSKVDSAGNRRASIGHKGLGFKSVLEITERPAAMSMDIAFELSEGIARKHVAGLFEELGLDVPASLPVMRFPDLLAEELPEWKLLRHDGFTTAFRFPFRPEIASESKDRLAENLLSLSLTTVLFLKHLDQVDVEVRTDGQDTEVSWQLQREALDGEMWQPISGLIESGMYRVSVSSSEGHTGTFLVAHNADVEIGEHRSGLSGPAWAGVTLSEVSVAVLEATDGLREMPDEWRRFHVFLPTNEPSPYPILVNGAFTTDLSRQAVRVSKGDHQDYNQHLIHQAATLFADMILPVLVEQGMDQVVATLDRDTDLDTDIANAFHSAMAAVISEVPLLPTNAGDTLALVSAVFPPVGLGDRGAEYRQLLVQEASWGDRSFPAAEVCTGRWARVGSDHGGEALGAADALTVLAHQLDPDGATATDHETGGFELDPVLEVCSAVYLSTPREDQPEVRKRARSECLFPTIRNPRGTFDRVSLEGKTAFYPPRSAKHHLPLSGLEFMSHAVCWGALFPNERAEALGERLKTWTLLFDVQEFRFEVVMREAVLPHLRIRGREGVSEEGVLANWETLTAVCQLAGRFPKPDRPLRYQRLGSDRGLFNLSRLPVPCRGQDDKGVEWIPAYRAYFGKDWIGGASIERLSEELSASDSDYELDVPILLPPDEFLGRLEHLDDEEELGQATEADGEGDGDEDEVDLDEDFDSRLESDELSAWTAFLKWVGVSDVMRPVHFHDVEDLESGWLSTKNLSQPKGWAFADLGDIWESYRSSLIEGDPRLTDSDTVPYFYELHDLEGLVTVLAAAERDPSGSVGSALIDHVATHWETLERYSDVTLALVKKGLYPSQRSKPPKPKAEEIAHGGDNFWLYRLKTRSHFPTSHGPRRPDQAWLMSEDVERRFGRRGQNAGDMVPVFAFDGHTEKRSLRAVCTRLGVRSALSPATFTLEDARLLCRRLHQLFGESAIDEANLREVIRPAYRELFELLAGRSGDEENQDQLREEPLLVQQGGRLWFQPSSQVLYSRTPGFLQRSGLQDQIATFVLEAEPSANAPLSELFGTRNLEDAIVWVPDPGECPLDNDEYSEFRRGLGELAPLVLARVRVERNRPQDGPTLKEFVERAEPVEELGLTCRIGDESYSLSTSREYYVRRRGRGDPLQAFLVWSGQTWPPGPDESQRLAMALADALEVNLVEAFLALIQSERDQRRRLLEIAGATRFLEDARAELESPDPNVDPDELTVSEATTRTVSPTDEPTDEQAPERDRDHHPAAPPVELVRFENLWIEGEPILVFGEQVGEDTRSDPGDRSHRNQDGQVGKAAPGTDLASLDALGMRIASAYETNRLRKMGVKEVANLPGDTPSDLRNLVVDVSTPGAISRARAQSEVVATALLSLQEEGISQVHPGFDILTIVDGEIDRMIELKSSAVDARVQSMTWNEWKSARNNKVRDKYWLYLVGNLRADLPAPPYLRAIKDPFGSLISQQVSEERLARAVQLRVREFAQAEHLYLVRSVEVPLDR